MPSVDKVNDDTLENDVEELGMAVHDDTQVVDVEKLDMMTNDTLVVDAKDFEMLPNEKLVVHLPKFFVSVFYCENRSKSKNHI